MKGTIEKLKEDDTMDFQKAGGRKLKGKQKTKSHLGKPGRIKDKEYKKIKMMKYHPQKEDSPILLREKPKWMEVTR